MGVTAQRLDRLGVVDDILTEPLGGAHRDKKAMAQTLQAALSSTLDHLCALPVETLLEQRHERLTRYGEFAQS